MTARRNSHSKRVPKARPVFKPKLGQHFLIDEEVRDRIIEAVPDDGLPIIEVGPGGGVLTEPLAASGRPLIAVELDDGLAAALQRRLPARAGFAVKNADILDTDAAELLAEIGAAPPYGVVGNLPYSITALLLRKFLSEERIPPRWLVVMVQREVAQLVVAEAGRRSLLSVSVQFYARPELLFTVEREAFDPPPQVRSAVLRIERRPEPAVDVPSEARFFEVVRGGFRAPRKQLHNSLSRGLELELDVSKAWIADCEIDSSRRAATLSLEEWARLAWHRERSGAPPPPGTVTA